MVARVALLLVVAAAAAPAVPADPAAPQPAWRTYRGHVSHEFGTWDFTPCGGQHSPIALSDGTGGDLARVYKAVGGGGQRVFMEFRARPGTSGRGPRIVSVRRAAAEGRGCDETWGETMFRARGNEPFWSIEVTESELTITRPGQDPVAVHPVTASGSGATRRYHATGDLHRADLRVTERRCVDGMSGEHFAFAVSAAIDEATVQGCGAERPDEAVNRPSAHTGVLGGTITYRQRSALPPGTVITVVLQDAARADAPAVTIGEQVITTDGRQVPIPFELTYDPALVDPQHEYTVRARIEVDGELRFTSTGHHPVLGAGHSATVEILVEPVGSSR